MSEAVEHAPRGRAAQLAAVLSIREGEGRKTALLFLHLFTASAIFILGRTVRDTLFLSRYPVSALPWMFVFYGIASAVTVVVYSRFADKLPRVSLIVGSCAIGILTYLGTYGAVRAELTVIYPVFYVWSEVVANLFIVQFWTLANDLNGPREARRLFPTVGAARVLGVVAIGLATGLIVSLIGTEQLLLVLVGLMVVVVGLALALRREVPSAPTAARKKPKPNARPPKVLGDKYVRALSVFLLLTFVALTLGDYQFKVIARATFQEDALASYFSLFYAGTGIVSFVFQIVVTPKLLRRFGVGWGMAVMPAVFGGASAILLGVPVLALATVMKFADNGFQYTVHETTLQALYVPFPERVKARTRAFLDAVVKPLSYGVGGLALVFLVPQVPEAHHLSVVVVGIVLVWLATIPWVRRRYVAALRRSLGDLGSLTLESMAPSDADARRELAKLLDEGDPRLASVALMQLEGELPDELVAPVQRLALEGEPEVRVLALKALALAERPDPAPIRAGLTSRSLRVRIASVDASGPVLGDGCVAPLSERLDDEDQDIRVGAVAGLLAHGGVEGAIVGGTRLGEMLSSEAPDVRIEAARVVRRLGTAAYRPVKALLTDPDMSVRQAGLRAAEKTGDPRLIPQLMAALRVPRTRRRATAALIAVGPAATGELLSLLADESIARELKLELPRILRRLPSQEALDGLAAHERDPDSHFRLRVMTARASLRLKLDAPPLGSETLTELLRWELSRAYRHVAAWEKAKVTLGTELTRQEWSLRRRRCTKRLLRALSLRYDKTTLDLVRKRLDSPAHRANALELLDGLLEPVHRGQVIPWFDDAPIQDRLARAADLVGEVPAPEQYLIELSARANPFAAAVALDAMRAHPSPRFVSAAEARLASDDAIVREMALVALAACDAARASALAERLREDPSPVVAARAAAVLDDKESPHMPTTLEKVLLLKSAAVFSSVEAEDLAPMAYAAEAEQYNQGDTILTEGEVGDVLYVIARGEVAVSRGGVELAKLGAGEAFGEMAVLDAEPRSATVIATEETELLAIGSEEFYEVLREQLEIAEGVIRMLTRRLRGLDESINRSSFIAELAPGPGEDAEDAG